MGTEITLELEGLLIDYAKNHLGNDHSILFNLSNDIKTDTEEIDGDIFSSEYCVTKLSLIKNRLDMLGASLYKIKKYYQQLIKNIEEDYNCTITLKFEEFYDQLKQINIPSKRDIDFTIYENYYLPNYIKSFLIKYKSKFECTEFEEQDSIIDVFCDSFPMYMYLRILSENEKNEDCKLIWNFGELVQNGWIKRTDAIHPLSRDYKIILVTEGTSDLFIIEQTIKLFYSDIYDFFEFIDMKENYPFTGVGNLYNFCLGLNKINIQNKVIAIFDNDTEGVVKYNELKSKINSNNIFILKLPFLEEFSKFNTIGPQGETIEDINERAVSIECFLDLSIKECPQIRWTSFNEKIKQYQGSLIAKDDYTRHFKHSLNKNRTYNYKKLKYLLDYIIEEWRKHDTE